MNVPESIVDVLRENESLREQLHEAQEALREFGRHDERCASRRMVHGEHRFGECDCGLDAALREGADTDAS